MDELPTFSYDQEADVLYISFAPNEAATSAVELNENILLRLNRAERRAVGLTLMDFSVLAQMTALGPRSFPLTGLDELEPEWQDLVIELITQPPVNEILRVSAYAPLRRRVDSDCLGDAPRSNRRGMIVSSTLNPRRQHLLFDSNYPLFLIALQQIRSPLHKLHLVPPLSISGNRK